MSTPRQDLVEASRRGDLNAFRELVETHEPLVGAVVIATMGHTHEVEDAVQDTFVSAWQSLDELIEIDKFRSWLGSIARNQAAKRRRRLAREIVTSEPPEPVAHGTAIDELLTQERQKAVEAALEEIPAQHREVLVLFYREGQSIREVARVLELSEGAAQKRISRARAAIREELSEFLAERLPSTRSVGVGAAVLGTIANLAPETASAASNAARSSVPGAKGIFTMKLLATVSSIAILGAGAATYVVSYGGGVESLAEPNEREVKSNKTKPDRAPPASTPPSKDTYRLRRLSSGERRQSADHQAAIAGQRAVEAREQLGAASSVGSDKQQFKAAAMGQWEPAIRGLVEECLELARVNDPDLFGRIDIRLTVSGEKDIAGLVTSATVVRRQGGFDPPNTEFEECLEETMMSVEFSDVKRDVTFKFPFEFEPPPHMAQPRPPTEGELRAAVAQSSDPEELRYLASDHFQQHPILAAKACDKAVRLNPEGESAYSCTMVACLLNDEERALRYWSGLGSEFKDDGGRKKVDFLCGRKDIELP